MKRIKGKMRLVVKDSRYLAIVAPEVLIERWVGVWGFLWVLSLEVRRCGEAMYPSSRLEHLYAPF